MNGLNNKLLAKSQRKIDILLSFGAHEELDSNLSKLIHFQIAKYNSNIKQIRCELVCFEEKYKMSSEAFFKRFEAGKLGDSADFFEWAGLYENILLFESKICLLEAALKSD